MVRAIHAVCLEVDQVLIAATDTGLLPGTPMAVGWCARDSIPLLLTSDQSVSVQHSLTDLPDRSPIQAITTKLTAVITQISTHCPLYAILIATWPGYTLSGDQALWDQQADQVAAALPPALANGGNRDTIIECSGDPLWVKPETGLLERAAALSGCDPGELLYIGATEADREMARAAGAIFLDAAAWRSRESPWPPW